MTTRIRGMYIIKKATFFGCMALFLLPSSEAFLHPTTIPSSNPIASHQRTSIAPIASSSSGYGSSFQPLGTPIKKPEAEPGFVLGLQEETVGTGFEEFLVNITKPLGLTVEEAVDGSGMVFVVDRGEKAEEAGVDKGDVVVGVSFIFGDDYLVNVTGKGVDRVQSLIRSRGPDYVCLRLRKGCEYHLAEEQENALMDEMDEETSLEPEEQEAQWISRANKIFVDEFAIDIDGISEGYEER